MKFRKKRSIAVFVIGVVLVIYAVVNIVLYVLLSTCCENEEDDARLVLLYGVNEPE